MKSQNNRQANDYLSDQEFKKMSTKQKLEYFWQYRRKQMIFFCIEVAIILALLIVVTQKKEVMLTGIALNSDDKIEKDVLHQIKNDLFEGTQLNPEKGEIELVYGLKYYLNDETKAEDNYSIVQMLVEQTKKNNLDFIVGDQETVVVLAYSEFFYDLSQVLSEEQIALYTPYLRYIDLSVVEQIKKAAESNLSNVDIEIPDCTKPEEMQNPIPIMIDITQYDAFTDLYPETSEPIVFAMFEGTPARNVLTNFIEYIIKE